MTNLRRSILLLFILAFSVTSLIIIGCDGSDGDDDTTTTENSDQPSDDDVEHGNGDQNNNEIGTYPQRFQVEGNKIVNESGNEVVLRGVSLENPVWQSDSNNNELIPFTEKTFEVMSTWGAKIVRLPIHPMNVAWSDEVGESILSVLDQAVLWAKKYQMYVYIDFHSVGFPVTDEYATESDGDPIYHTTKEDIKKFWNAMSSHYYNNKTVAFYEIFNEPTWSGFLKNGLNGDDTSGDQAEQLTYDWISWKGFVEEVIDVIRANDPDKIALVGGLAFNYDLSYVSQYPVEKDNVAYATHPYPFKHYNVSWEDAFGKIKEKYPVFVTEFGFDTNDNSTMPESDFEMYEEYQLRGRYRDAIKSYLEEKKIGWTAWCFSHDWTTNLLINGDYEPSESGAFFQQWLLEKQ